MRSSRNRAWRRAQARRVRRRRLALPNATWLREIIEESERWGRIDADFDRWISRCLRSLERNDFGCGCWLCAGDDGHRPRTRRFNEDGDPA